MANSDNGELNKSVFGSSASDPNNSLLKKVTKRVSDFFPSSLTKWFGPSDGSQAVVRPRDSDDEDEDSPEIQEPPRKRIRSEPDMPTSNNFNISPISHSLSDCVQIQPGPSGYTRRTTQSTTFEPSSANSHTSMANGDDNSDSDESTSGYSSVQQQRHKEPLLIPAQRNNLMLAQPSTSKQTSPNKSFNTSLNSSRSLFSDQSINPSRQCMSSRRPSFSASTFGSPSFVDRTLSTTRAINSPFYGGKTTFGGASAYRSKRIFFPRDDKNSICAKNSVSIKPEPKTSGNDSVNLSKNARRILDALEHFSTPVLDARKIPKINKRSCNSNRNARKPIFDRTASTKELLVPIVPDLIKMKLKERIQDSTEQIRKVATSSKSVLNSEYSIKTIEETSKPVKHVNKMKMKVTSTRSKPVDDDERIEEVKLPDIQLPITNLPKFDFTLPPPPKPVTKSTTMETVTNVGSQKLSNSMLNRITHKIKKNTKFEFVKPIFISKKPKFPKQNHKYTFSKPLDGKTKLAKRSTTATFTFNPSSTSTAPRPKEPLKNNGQNNNALNLPSTTHFVTGSVMDILGKSSEIKKDEPKNEKNDLMDKFKPGVGTWECSVCMVRNLPTATCCSACEALKEPPKKIGAPNTTHGFGNKFKINDKWECKVCMVRNNNTDTKCVACTATKSSSEPSPTTQKIVTSPKPLDSFGDKFKPETGSWECTSCLLRNKSEAIKCPACETPKPGSTENKPALVMPPDTKSCSGFADFISKQQQNWECQNCMVRNPTEKKICVCCEAPKPGEKQEMKLGTQINFGTTGNEPVTFSFGIKPSEKISDTKPVTMSNTSTSPATTGFTFGIPIKKLNNDSNDKSTFIESFLSNSAEVKKSPQFKFTSPASIVSTNIFGNSTTNVTSNFTSVTVTQSPAKPIFSFGVTTSTTTSVSPSTSLFTNVTKSCLESSPTTISKPLDNAVVPTTTTVFASSMTAVSPTTTTITTPGTLFFKAPTTTKPLTFGSDNKAPLFNFGSGGLPFSSVSQAKPSTCTSTVTDTFGNNSPAFTTPITKSEAPAFGGSMLNFTFPSTTANKTETKPFSFTGTSETTKPGYLFTPRDNPPSSTPVTKSPMFNFGATTNNQTPTATGTTLFNFNTTKTEKPTFGTGSLPGFSEPQSSGGPQNGGFNFGGTNVNPVTFKFGAPSTSATAPIFGFGSNQAGSGSTMPASVGPAGASPATPTAGLFTFGASAPAPQSTPAFSPDVKPNFNFTGGSLPNFTAHGALPPAAGGAVVQRKIRKAVRRTQPR